MGAKTKSEYLPPPTPRGFNEIADHAELVSIVEHLSVEFMKTNDICFFHTGLGERGENQDARIPPRGR